LNNPELTAEKFPAAWGDEELSTHNLLYKTGDLARMLPDGRIEFLGRQDKQVKIRGLRVEPGEIEKRLLKYPRIKEAIVVGKQDAQGETYLCAYYVPGHDGHDVAISELRDYLSAELPGNMIPAYFAAVESFPLSAGGKIDMKFLPEPERAAAGEFAAPRNETEKRLSKLWQEILNDRDIPQGRSNEALKKISIRANFFELGGHSLKAAILTAKIHQVFDVDVPLIEIFKQPTIAGLSSYIDRAFRCKYESIKASEKREYYNLSPAQKRMYILQQMDAGGAAYNLPGKIPIAANIKKEELVPVIKKLVGRHEGLRTTFEMVQGRPVQRVHRPGDIDIGIEYYEIGDGQESIRGIVRHFTRPFDLAQAPLLRAGLVQGKHFNVLLFDLHHIIADGLSFGILREEFYALCHDAACPVSRLQYKDYAQWQEDTVNGERLRKQEKYWLAQFSGEVPRLSLPTDYTRPGVQSFAGSIATFMVDEEETALLKGMVRETETTLFMVILSLYIILLSKLSGDEDIVTGIPVAGRRHADLERLVGMFVNTLAIRSYPTGGKSYEEYVAGVRQAAVDAFENREYQFEDLVEKLEITRDAGRNPLFDVMFSLPNHGHGPRESGGLPDTGEYENKQETAKFDLTLTAVEHEDRLHCSFEYCVKLFKPETIARLAVYFKRIIQETAGDLRKKISEIEIYSGKEKQRLIYEFNNTAADYPKQKTVSELFAGQAAKTPGHLALIFEDMAISYRKLQERSHLLAATLKDRAVGADTIVGLFLERSPWIVIGMLGILAAGGAFLPISPDYPEKRRNRMLKDSGAALVLTGRDLYMPVQNPGGHRVEPVFIEDIDNRPGTVDLGVTPATNLCYVMYTSGSTGVPKGVMAGNRNVINVVAWFAGRYKPAAGVHVLQLTDYTFDPIVEQIFGTLCFGAALYVVSKESQFSINKLRLYIDRHRINMINFVPSLLKELLAAEKSEKLASLDVVISGGERLDPSLRDNLISKGYRLYNHYGPTEITVDALTCKCTEGKVTLGGPIANTHCYILNKYHELLPIGAAGELCISGAGVAAGYLNNPEVTSERFINFTPTGERIYKTGDLARRLPGGNIEFLGRIDKQVKIRGFRIEPGEIENRIAMFPGIAEVVVTVRQNDRGERYLCAYIAAGSGGFGAKVDIEGLRDSLSAELPGAMIPSYFVEIPRIPVNPNGKVDMKSLPEPELTIGEGCRSPRNSMERRLVDTWSEVLMVDKKIIGIDTNFFELGGNSLKAVAVVDIIRREFKVNIPVAELFQAPNIRKLSSLIEVKNWITAGAAKKDEELVEIVL
jgi:surfactin family lipopeptide synthetase A